MKAPDHARTFYHSLDKWCVETSISIFQLGVQCEQNDHYFYHLRRRGSVPPPALVRKAAGVLRQPSWMALVAAGYILLADLEEYRQSWRSAEPPTSADSPS
ncbi:MAG: hypothetical protein ACYDC5_02750 [Candidatus Dormibacteria bacterium]